jgi:hypothetical protein
MPHVPYFQIPTFFMVFLSFCTYDFPLMLGSSLNTGWLSLADLLSSLPCELVSCSKMTAFALSSDCSFSSLASSLPCPSSLQCWLGLVCSHRIGLQVLLHRFDRTCHLFLCLVLDLHSYRLHRLHRHLRLVGCFIVIHSCNPISIGKIAPFQFLNLSDLNP